MNKWPEHLITDLINAATAPLIRLYIISLIVFCGIMRLTGQGNDVLVLNETSSPQFDTTQLREYLEDPAYHYQKRAPKTSWIQRIWQDFLRYLERMFSDGADFGERLFSILLVAGAIVLLSYFFLRSRFQNLFVRGDRRNGRSMRILDEDIPIEQLAQKIKVAIQEGDYRTAYRWTYIDLLHRLGQSGTISLHGNKTNRDYKREIRAPQIQSDFATLADAFDFTWYGEYPIDQSTFDAYNTLVVKILGQSSKA